MDEAGYGPNLGPLVVAATAWQIASGSGEWGVGSKNPASPLQRAGEKSAIRNRYRTAAHQGRSPIRFPTPHSPLRIRIALTFTAYCALSSPKCASERRIAIADSKVLYYPGLGLRQLERGIHTVLRSMRESLASWSSIVEYCGADPDGHHNRACWPEDFVCPLPIDAANDEVSRLEARFTPRVRGGRRPPAVHSCSPRLSRSIQRSG